MTSCENSFLPSINFSWGFIFGNKKPCLGKQNFDNFYFDVGKFTNIENINNELIKTQIN